jgi:hypothetical protein
LPEVNGCQVAFVISYRTDRKETHRERNQVDLGDLDPTSLKGGTGTSLDPDDVSPVTVQTTDKLPAIQQMLFDRAWRPAMWTIPSTYLMWELSAPYAARFAKALEHAITLCGGKRSSF